MDDARADEAHTRASDPDTSHEAAAAVTPNLRELQARVEAFAIAAGPSGFIDVDMQNALEDTGSTLRTRRSELTARNIVLDSGLRRKLVGSAQWRHDGALLQHGSILIDDDQPLLACCASAPLPTYTPPATLRAILGRAPSRPEIVDALFDAAERFGAALGASRGEVVRASASSPLPIDDAALCDEVARLLPRYRDPAWTWRR